MLKNIPTNRSLLLCAMLVLAGCDTKAITDPVATDQCMRIELFRSCMASLPKGPEHVHNSNDWDEVVGKCDTVAYYQSRRASSFIEPKCRVQ